MKSSCSLQQAVVDALGGDATDPDAAFSAHAATAICLAAMHTALTRWAQDNGRTKLPDLIAQALAASFGDIAVAGDDGKSSGRCPRSELATGGTVAGLRGRSQVYMSRGQVRQVLERGQEELTELWQQQWPNCPPVGYRLRDPYRDVWVRFHSLPKSKRYAEDEGEYRVVLERYNTVLDELFADADVYVITPLWTTETEVPPCPPGAGYWQSLLVRDDPDPEFRTYCHMFTVRRLWRRGCIDEVLRDIADDQVAGVLITDTRMQRIYYPYDGGADVFFPTSEERDQMRDRHASWLSSHPSGL